MEEHRERVSTATNAVTLGDLQALVADLQTDSALVQLPVVKPPPKAPTYASIDRPDPTDDRRMLAYDYRGGWGDPTSSAKSGADGPVAVDLSKFDPAATVGILRGAPETLHLKPSDVTNTYLIIEPAPDPTAPGALSVYVSSDYGGGSIVFAGDGTVKRLNLPS